jgi:hypothetical protein
VALVTGEAGSGKTRLARELAREAVESGTLVLFGGCDPVVGAPYQPFSEALEHLVRVSDPAALELCLDDGEREIARLVPGLAAPTDGGELQADPATERRRLHTAVCRLLANVSRLAPLLLVVDDLQWADASSLHLLRDVTRFVPETRMLVVATARDRGEDHRAELSSTLSHLSRVDGLVRMRLGELARDEIEEFVRRAADAPPSADLTDALQAGTDGTPFLLCELWRAWTDAGALASSGGAVVLARPADELATPEGVRDVVQHRLSRLAPGTTALLEVAAIAGTRFDPSILGPEAEVASALDEAVRSGIIEEVPGLGLSHRFSHELVRTALCERLPRVRRAELHLQVAEALERRHAAYLAPVLPELAHHFAAAAPLGGTERAVAYNIRAAEAATAVAMPEAAKNLSTALELGIPDERTRGRVQLELARAVWLTGDQERAGEILDDALDSACEAGDEQTEWYVRLELAGLPRERSADLEDLARRAADVFERLGDDLGLARARRRIAVAATDRLAFGEALREAELGLQHAVAAGDRGEELRLADSVCTALLYGPTPAGPAIARCRELLERAPGSPMMEAVILSVLAGVEGMTGRFDDARATCSRVVRLYEQLELPVFVAVFSAISAPIELAAREPEAAEDELRRGIAFLRELPNARDAVALRRSLLAVALDEQGRRTDAVAAIDGLEPVNLMTRITFLIATARVRENVTAAEAAVDLASVTDALNLRADAEAVLGRLLHGEDGRLHTERARDFYLQKANVPAAHALSEE